MPGSCHVDASSPRVVDFFGRLQRRVNQPGSHLSDTYMRNSFKRGRRLVVKAGWCKLKHACTTPGFSA